MDSELDLGGFYTCVQDGFEPVVIWIGRLDLTEDLGAAALATQAGAEPRAGAAARPAASAATDRACVTRPRHACACGREAATGSTPRGPRADLDRGRAVLRVDPRVAAQRLARDELRDMLARSALRRPSLSPSA